MLYCVYLIFTDHGCEIVTPSITLGQYKPPQGEVLLPNPGAGTATAVGYSRNTFGTSYSKHVWMVEPIELVHVVKNNTIVLVKNSQLTLSTGPTTSRPLVHTT